MGRNLTTAMNAAVLSSGRQPRWRVYVYDIQSGENTLTDVVAGNPLTPTTGPREFTDDIISVEILEKAGDYTQDGINSTILTLELDDPHQLFDPANLLDDPTGDGRWLRRGNVIRLIEGDARVPEAQWETTFTGSITGNAGVVVDRSSLSGNAGVVSSIVVSALSREAPFLQFVSNSVEYGIGATLQSVAEDIAANDMNLDSAEINLPTLAAKTLGHPTVFVEEPPLVSIAKILFVYTFAVKFDGRGRLTAFNQDISKAPERVYSQDQADLMIGSIRSQHGEVNPFNSIVVLGLDKDQTKITQPRQALADVRITTGYFTTNEEEEVYWSEDRTVAADNVQLEVLKSVGISLFGFSFGVSEGFTPIPAPTPGEGDIGAILEISTGFSPAIIVFLTAGYIATAYIPDEVVVGIGTGFTIPTGRIAQATALSAVLLVMTRIGRGTYQFTGEPFEYVFKELRGRAEVFGLETWERVELEVRNQLLNTQVDVDEAARSVLFYQQAKGSPRSAIMYHDLRLEPGDIFEMPSGRRYIIESISRTLTRDSNEPLLAEVGCFEVTSGTFL